MAKRTRKKTSRQTTESGASLPAAFSEDEVGKSEEEEADKQDEEETTVSDESADQELEHKAGPDPVEDEPSPDEEPDGDELEESLPGEEEATGEGLGEEVIEHGRQLGFSDEEMNAFGSEEAASTAFAAVDRRLAEMFTVAGPSPAAVPTPAQARQQPKAATVSVKSEPVATVDAEAEEIEKFELELEDAYDPHTAGQLKKLHTHYERRDATHRQEIKDLKEAFTGFTDHFHAKTALATAKRIDQFFDGLEDPDTFGPEPCAMTQAESPEGKARSALIKQAGDLQMAYLRAGQGMVEDAVCLKRAHRILYAGQLETKTRKKLGGALAKVRGRATHRPSQTRGQELPTGEAKAAKTAEKWAKDHAKELEDDEF